MAMPHVCGYDVVKALNRLNKRPKIGIITGWDVGLKPTGYEDTNIDFIIRKPFNFKTLTKHINELSISG
jgi:FixJ family two-component response regulator